MRRWRAVLALALMLTASLAEARGWSWLGVRIRDLSEPEMDELAKRHGIREGYGVVIVEVMEGTPAQRAGMKNGDIVVAVDERPVTDTRVLQRLIAAGPVERDARLTVLRPEGRRPLGVRLVAMPRTIAGERVAAEFGFILRDPDPQPEIGGRRPGGTAPTVTLVIRGSAAERAGLQTGDVILQINDTAVVTRDAAREALADLATEQPFKLTVRRGQRHLALDVPAAERVPQ
ncbi:MAG TPA: PDZ domain-containing protein [Methylomirabilota bacterium]